MRDFFVVYAKIALAFYTLYETFPSVPFCFFVSLSGTRSYV